MMTINYAAFIKKLLAEVESNNLDKYLSFFTDDAEYKIGNAEPLIGHQGIGELASSVSQTIQSVTHDIKNIWQVEDNIAVCQADVIYNRKDGKVFKLPNITILRFRGEKIHKYQAFIDASPVFSSFKLDNAMVKNTGAFQDH